MIKADYRVYCEGGVQTLDEVSFFFYIPFFFSTNLLKRCCLIIKCCVIINNVAANHILKDHAPGAISDTQCKHLLKLVIREPAAKGCWQLELFIDEKTGQAVLAVMIRLVPLSKLLYT
ncbi:hypothetical protein [Bacillus smithii]